MWCVSFFFFFKQKTAYEMRSSDWSSDVCSSDLQVAEAGAGRGAGRGQLVVEDHVVDAGQALTTDRDGPRHPEEAAVEERLVPGRHPGPVLVEIGRASCRERVCQSV